MGDGKEDSGIEGEMFYRTISHGISCPFVCRVVDADGQLRFIGRQVGDEKLPLNGVFTNSAASTEGTAIHLLKVSNPFKDGDILLVRPDGCRLLFRRGWSNAVFLTSRCNNHCICCPQPPREDHEDYLAVALAMLDLVENDEIHTLGVTGGEPTVVWDKLIPLLQTISNRPKTAVQILTNGRALADYGRAEALAASTEGRCLVCIPLYSDTHHIHDEIACAPGSFWETIAGIKNLARLTIPVEMRVLIVKPNYLRLPQIARFIYMNLPFVSHVAFMGMELVGFAARNIADLWISPPEYMLNLEEAVHLLRQRNVEVSIYNHPLCILPPNLVPFARKSISEWKVRYAVNCTKCSLMSDCSGCFASTFEYLKDKLTPDYQVGLS